MKGIVLFKLLKKLRHSMILSKVSSILLYFALIKNGYMKRIGLWLELVRIRFGERVRDRVRLMVIFQNVVIILVALIFISIKNIIIRKKKRYRSRGGHIYDTNPGAATSTIPIVIIGLGKLKNFQQKFHFQRAIKWCIIWLLFHHSVRFFLFFRN